MEIQHSEDENEDDWNNLEVNARPPWKRGNPVAMAGVLYPEAWMAEAQSEKPR